MSSVSPKDNTDVTFRMNDSKKYMLEVIIQKFLNVSQESS